MINPRFEPSIRKPLERSGIIFPIDACWLLDKHEEQAEDIYARTEMDIGPARLRRKYTEVPVVRKAQIFLNAEQSKRFHEWFENTLGVGQLRFQAQFHGVGQGIRWFEAEFVKPWEAEYVALGEINEDGNAERAWKITVELRLYGDGTMRDPRETPDFAANFKLPLETKCFLKDANYLTVQFSCPLTSRFSNDTLEVNFFMPLVSRGVSPNTFGVDFYTYLSAKATMRGKRNFSVHFSM